MQRRRHRWPGPAKGAQIGFLDNRPLYQSVNCGLLELNNMSVDPAVIYVCIHRYDVTKTHTHVSCIWYFGGRSNFVELVIQRFFAYVDTKSPLVLSRAAWMDGKLCSSRVGRKEGPVHLESSALSTIFCLCGRGRATCPVTVAA
jgi:hypothetical protein